MPLYEVEFEYDGGSGCQSFCADSAYEAEYEFWDRRSVANAEGCRVVRVREKKEMALDWRIGIAVVFILIWLIANWE